MFRWRFFCSSTSVAEILNGVGEHDWSSGYAKHAPSDCKGKADNAVAVFLRKVFVIWVHADDDGVLRSECAEEDPCMLDAFAGFRLVGSQGVQCRDEDGLGGGWGGGLGGGGGGAS